MHIYTYVHTYMHTHLNSKHTHIYTYHNIIQRILYRVSTISRRCILGVAPVYLSELFVLSSSCPGRRSLRLASRGDYMIPRSYPVRSSEPKTTQYVCLRNKYKKTVFHVIVS